MMGRLPDGVPEVDLVGLQRPYVVLDQLAGAVLLEVVRSYRKRHLLEVWEGLREERQERQALLVLREASLFQLRRHLIVLPQAVEHAAARVAPGREVHGRGRGRRGALAVPRQPAWKSTSDLGYKRRVDGVEAPRHRAG